MLSVLEKSETAESVLTMEPSAAMRLTADLNGMSMTVDEFHSITECEPGYRFELIHGVLIVSPTAGAGERDPNDELGFWLRTYREKSGATLDLTLPEQELETSAGVRRADRAIWTGLGRRPVPGADAPSIVVEFVSGSSRDRRRDYEEKRLEYAVIGVCEYWIIDRFRRTMTVCRGMENPAILRATDTYTTPLMPGFELALARLFAITDSWSSSGA